VSRDAKLARQTVLVIDGSSGIGVETARLAREEGAEIIITARDPDRVYLLLLRAWL
jgi:NAD(P)-dependent dehydrogenase (short-subunit alcohol dehydrogenase family)